jgi:hypothetical protein
MKMKETTKKILIPEHIASGRKSWWSSIANYRGIHHFQTQKSDEIWTKLAKSPQ